VAGPGADADIATQDSFADRDQLEVEHWWFEGRRTILLHLLDRELGADNTERRILDMGCGTGTMLQHLDRYGTAEGLETDEAMVRSCHARGLSRVRLASPPPLPYDTESFDLITLLDVLEHIEDDRGVLREVARALRPGGLLLLTVPAYQLLWGPQDRASEHKRRYRASQVKERIEEAGLEARRLTYFNTLMFPPAAAIKLIRRVTQGDSERSDCEMSRPGRVNDSLARVFKSEARLLDRMDLPFGLSVLCVATKPVAKSS
jgi:SAM-dependent methyltransferase